MPDDRLDDTRPGVAVNPNPYRKNTRGEVPAPPKILLYGVIGIFLLGIIGVVGTVVVFRNVLEPGQQERVIGILPFMEKFLPPHPAAGDTLPTLEPGTPGDVSAQDLLNLSFDNTATPTPAEPTATPTLEPTEVAQIQPTLEPTATEVIPTLEPPTLEPMVAPTQEVAVHPATNTTLISTGNVSYPVNSVLPGITYVKQTWNNCGPANVTMALSYFGWKNDQAYAASYLKPGGREDKNVSPLEIVNFVNNQTQVKALTRPGGDLNLLKALISNSIPVMIETGYYTNGSDWLGHYQTVVGYDDNTGVFYVNDSNIGENHIEEYNYLDTKWQHFNRRFIAIYLPQNEALVASILGDLADPMKAAEHAFNVAQEEAKRDSTNAFAWFNMGSSLVAMGDYERAAVAYDKAQSLGKLPWRMLWYQFGLYEAYYNVGRYTDVIKYAETTLSTTGNYVEEAHYWLGMALQGEGRNTEAGSAFRQALNRNPQYEAARVALNQLTN